MHKDVIHQDPLRSVEENRRPHAIIETAQDAAATKEE